MGPDETTDTTLKGLLLALTDPTKGSHHTKTHREQLFDALSTPVPFE